MTPRPASGRRVCRHPGCPNPRRPRRNRVGAPPAYCTDHNTDSARAEYRRRHRLGLPLDAALDEHDRPVEGGAETETENEPDESQAPSPEPGPNPTPPEHSLPAPAADPAAVRQAQQLADSLVDAARAAGRLADQLADQLPDQLPDQLASDDAVEAIDGDQDDPETDRTGRTDRG